MTAEQTPPAPLAFTTVSTSNGDVTVPCEPINDWLAITPVFSMDAGGKTWLNGGFTVTHRPTGLIVADGPGCIECCRAAGKELASLDVDWATLNAGNGREWAAALSDGTKRRLGNARAVDWSCDADYCYPRPVGVAESVAVEA